MEEKNVYKNKVIIIGNDHINTLGVIRTFGENNIKPYVLVISDTKKIAIAKSKYIEKYWICNESINIVELLKKEFAKEEYKPVIITTSDYITALLDIYYDELKKYFILANINKERKAVKAIMDKYEQFLLFKKHEIKCANSLKVILEEKVNLEKIKKMKFPCIIKPLISAFGSKDDIRICNKFEEIAKTLSDMQNIGYKEVLIQEFIKYDYEYDIAGFIYNNNVSIPGVIRKNRIWPSKKGSTTYGEVLPIKEVEKFIEKIKKMLSKINYTGIFDIDVFVKDSQLYINEINFRNGAISYAFWKSYICYYWYLSCVQDNFIGVPEIKENYNIIDEHADLHNVKERKITFKKYIEERKKAKVKLVYNKFDKKPSRYMFFYKIFNKIKVGKIFKNTLFKIIHKDKKAYILMLDHESKTKKSLNSNYDIIKINKDNFQIMSEGNKKDNNVYKKIFKDDKANGIVFMKENEIIGRGILKKKGCYDYFVNLIDNDSYLISLMHVNPKYRGKNYQYELVNELMNNFIEDIESKKVYTVIHTTNYASLRNLQKCGFKIIKEIQIIRMLKKSINKENI